MKSKLLVAAVACLALGACQKESNKDKEQKTTTEQTETTTTTPAHPETAPAAPGHSSMYDNDATHIAADDQNAQTAPQSSEHDMTNKAEEVKQDSANTLNQTQGTAADQTQATDQNTHSGSTSEQAH